MRIRYFDFLANRQRQEKLALRRRRLGKVVPSSNPAPGSESMEQPSMNDER
jgi:hypothetical protein